MANVDGTFYSGQTGRPNSSPESPPDLQGQQPYPVNPPGSNPVFDTGIGIKLNGLVIGGVKRLIEIQDSLVIPIYWQYNIHANELTVTGEILNDGEINID